MGSTPVLAQKVWANENPKIDTHTQELNLELYDCEVNALPHNQGQNVQYNSLNFTGIKQEF